MCTMSITRNSTRNEKDFFINVTDDETRFLKHHVLENINTRLNII